MTRTLLDVRLSAGYGRSTVLDDVGFTLGAGDALGVVGMSGAGKSTLLLALLGLLSTRGGWETGSVQFDGEELAGLSQRKLRAYRGRSIALIPQSPLSALSPVLSLQAHFREAWLAHAAADTSVMNHRIANVMDSVRLPPDTAFLARRPSQISVGQAQRVLIALAMLHRPRLLIADEPTSALDPVSRMEILHLLAELRAATGTALLYVSHDILSVLQVCDRIAVIDEGRIIENLPASRIAGSRHAAVQQLLAALPVPVAVLLQHLQPAWTASSWTETRGLQLPFLEGHRLLGSGYLHGPK